MRHRHLLLALLLVVAVTGCDADDAAPSSSAPAVLTTTTSTSTTTTTIDPRKTCEDIASDAATLMEDIVSYLGDADLDVLVQRAAWPEALADLESRGGVLDQQVNQAGCDPGTVQQAALDAVAGVEPGSRIAEILLELLTA